MKIWDGYKAGKTGNRHKYDYGHVALLCGKDMPGAICLSALSALRAGAGLVTVFASSCVIDICRVYSPSLIVKECESCDFPIQLDEKYSVVVIGPGAGRDNPAGLRDVVLKVLAMKKRIVLDADALTVFDSCTDKLYDALHSGVILTPHQAEFGRIFPGLTQSSNIKAAAAARMSGAFIVLKGQQTFIAAPDGRVECGLPGSAWLATAGSGDVLAGIIAGLAAWESAPVFEAIGSAVAMHSRASAIAGPGMISSDLTDCLPQVWKEWISDC